MSDRPGLSRATIILILLASLAVAGGVAAVGVHLARNHFERYPPAAESGFLETCERSGSAELCGCVLNALEKKYTFKEFSAFADRFASTGRLPEGAIAAFDSCAH